MSRFETEILTSRKNLKSLMDVPGKWIERIRRRRSLDKLILDLNSSVSQTYGRQERWHHLWCEGAAEHPNRVSVVVIIEKAELHVLRAEYVGVDQDSAQIDVVIGMSDPKFPAIPRA